MRALLIPALLLVAQPAWPQTLAPGKPAGTKAAQHVSYRAGFIAVSIIAVALTFALPGSTTSTTATTG
jgi:hypothetical protein